MMAAKRPRTKRATNTQEDSDDGNFFSSSDGDEGNLSFMKNFSMAKPDQNTTEQPKNKIVSFSDASQKITSILNALQEYKIPQKYTGPVYFIPEQVLSQDELGVVHEYLNGNINELPFNNSDYDEVIEVQMELVKYSKDPTVNIAKYADSKIDSRILSIVYFCLGKQNLPNHSISLYYFYQQ